MAIEPWQVLLVVAVVAVSSAIKGVVGIGGPMLAIPVLATMFDVERAVVVMALPGVLMNAWLVWEYRDADFDQRNLAALVGTGLVGVAVGIWGLVALDARVLSGLLAVVVVGYLVARLRRPGFVVSSRTSRALSPVVGGGAGIMQGATGISAPVVATWVHAHGLTRAAYLLTVSAIFLVFSIAQVVGMAAAGLYTSGRVVESVLASIPVVALPLGSTFGRRLSIATFNRLVLWSLGGLAVKLAWDVVAG